MSVALLAVLLLPETIGDYSRGKVTPAAIAQDDRPLFEEFRLRASERAPYRSESGRLMDVEALRFADSIGSHAAYLWLRPVGAIESPMSTRYRSSEERVVNAAVGSGQTIAQWKNYVFRFRGDAPASAEFDRITRGLLDADPSDAPSDVDHAYAVPASERWILGPVSLSRFAIRVPPAVAAFRVGARGRVLRHETPAGLIESIEFEYPDEVAASARLTAFRSLHGADVRQAGKSVRIIFDPVDSRYAGELFEGTEPITITFDRSLFGDDLGLDDGFSMVLSSSIPGLAIAAFMAHRRRVRWQQSSAPILGL
ncbi:MAG: hypothetical protein U0Q16_23660 [Bryobacteraceae bacterium]